jgi:hypothetical protein
MYWQKKDSVIFIGKKNITKLNKKILTNINIIIRFR